MRLTTLPTVSLAAAVALLLNACVSRAPADPGGAGPERIDARNDGSGCQSMVARYVDLGTAESGRPRTLAQVLDLDPETVESVPDTERAIDLRHVVGDRYVLAIAKSTPPDTVDLFAVDVECTRDVLRFETRNRYESDDGVHVRREQLRFVLIADADGTLVVRRQLRNRAIGLLDLKRGGDPTDTFRFARQ